MYQEKINIEKSYDALEKELFKLSENGHVHGMIFVGITKEQDGNTQEIEVINCLPGIQYHLMGNYSDHCYFTHKNSTQDIIRFLGTRTRPGENQDE